MAGQLEKFIVREWAFRCAESPGAPGRIVTAAYEGRENIRDSSYWSESADALEKFVGIFYEAQHQEKHRNDAGPNDQLGKTIDDVNDKDDIRRAAGHFVQTPWLHCRTFAVMALITVLDTEIYPLRREVNDPGTRASVLAKTGLVGLGGIVAASSSTGWRVFWTITGWLWTLVLCAIVLVSMLAGWWIVAVVVGAWLAQRIYRKYKSQQLMGKLASLLHSMQQIRAEIATGSFSASRIAERLRELEAQGAFIPSVSYDLLSLLDRLPPDTAVSAPDSLAQNPSSGI